MNVTLIAWTPATEQIVAAAGKTCYSNKPASAILDTMTDEAAAKFIRKILSSGHHSVLEHVSFTFSIEGVSRSLLAQITRHRIASFSVQSQRYVDMANAPICAPKMIKDNPHALRVFEDLMDETHRAYRDIHAYLLSEQLHKKYGDFVKSHPDLPAVAYNNSKYFHLVLDSKMNALKDAPEATVEDHMLYATYKKDRAAAEKTANENARAVLPNATVTNITMTMNARELLHFFNMRCCNRAQDEIRDLADKMLVLCKQVAPTIFEKAGAPCVSGPCPEGEMSCGHPKKG